MASGSILKNTLPLFLGLLIFSLHAEETNSIAPTAAQPAPVIAQPAPTPPPPPQLMIDSPQPNEVFKKSDVDIVLHIANGTQPPEQNRFHIFLDRESPILHEDESKPVTLKNLTEGGHVLRALAVQPNGLSLPLPGSFAAVKFFVKKKDFKNFVDLSKPYLTVNLPMGGATELDDKQRVCFDFLVHNAELNGKDGYKVRYILNRREVILSETKPIYWSDLPPGKHSLVVELLDPSDNPVLGLFSRVERKFEIAPVLKPLTTRSADDNVVPED